LPFSDTMVKELIKDLQETMGADLAFVQFPDRLEYHPLISHEEKSQRVDNPEAFVKALIDAIPPDASSLENNYFIVNDSTNTPGYRELHPEPFRFLGVIMEHSGSYYGWLGLISFNLEEIFRWGELRLLKSVASSSAIAMENSRLYLETLRTAEKERYIRNIFQKYVPEVVAQEILGLGERDLITLGEKRLVTLLNVDIRGYSRMSKRVIAEDVVKVLNYFFMTMGSVVLNHNGIVDKYLGDGLLAIFGAPVASPNPALDATLAAVEMVGNLETVNEFVHKWYGMPLKIGISINTGQAVVGNIGFEKKMDYTVIGDVVNDTFRLQALTKETPNSIFISETTYQKVEPFVHARFLGMRALGANEGHIKVYEVKGTRETA